MTVYDGHHVKLFVVTYYNNDPVEGYAGSKVFTTKSAAKRWIDSEVKDFLSQEDSSWFLFDEGFDDTVSLRDREEDDYTTLEYSIGEQNLLYMRECTHCDSPMNEGYCIDDGLEYYCSDSCLHHHYSPEEYAELLETGYGYYSTWDEHE